MLRESRIYIYIYIYTLLVIITMESNLIMPCHAPPRDNRYQIQRSSTKPYRPRTHLVTFNPNLIVSGDYQSGSTEQSVRKRKTSDRYPHTPFSSTFTISSLIRTYLSLTKPPPPQAMAGNAISSALSENIPDLVYTSQIHDSLQEFPDGVAASPLF